MKSPDEVDRRQFAKGLFAATAVAATATMANIDAEQPKVIDQSKTELENDKDRNEVLPMELALLNYIIQRYPSEHYDRAVLRGIYSDIRGDVARGEILSRFPLENSDEPAFVFRAWRADD